MIVNVGVCLIESEITHTQKLAIVAYLQRRPAIIVCIKPKLAGGVLLRGWFFMH